MKEGYFELGEAKGIAFLIIGSIFAALFLILKNKKILSELVPADLFDFAALTFLFSNLVSFAFSIDKKISFFGLEGWRTGLLCAFILFICLLCYREADEMNEYLVMAALITPCFEFVMGIFNRFGVNFMDIYGKNNSFLATIGNINWYAGFLCVFVPLGVGICYSEKEISKKFFFSGIYSYIGLIALFLQGSDSALLILAGTYIPLLLIALEERQSFKRYLFQLATLGFSMETVYFLMLFSKNHYNYEESLIMSLPKGHHGLIILAAAFFFYRLTKLFEEIKAVWRGKLFLKISIAVILLAVVAAVIWLIRFSDYSFGNGRGLIWSISVDMYGTLSPWQKLVGVGQDCYCAYAYSHPEIADSLLNVFPGNILTNAHCELLTILMERGLLGLFSYLFLMGSAFYLLYKNKRKSAVVICALPVLAYLFNGLVSFSTPVSTPYIFILLGMGAGFCRQGTN
ncbi:MAG: O-antigen ligase family protein [Butyrivibrio sp.]|nr:O-antigen ligase family protein [Butyrivibrio sp.]